MTIPQVNSEIYKKQQENTIQRNWEQRKVQCQTKRIKMISEWVNSDPDVLSVGSGGYEPLAIGASHACDISTIAEGYLRGLGWDGLFEVGSCTLLPYHDMHFSRAYCTEVIEHLPELDDVVKTFEEIDRVAVDWMVTTPSRRRGCKNPDPDHKRDFTEDELRACITPKGYQIFNDQMHFYVVKERGDPNAKAFREIFNRYQWK